MPVVRKRKLPTGVQTFREIREDDCYYVDKTEFALQLAKQGKCYFLSRPRRFGKSLFLDTLKELFEGNEALFSGLYIHGRWDWRTRYPVVRISFGAGQYDQPGMAEANFLDKLDAAEQIARAANKNRATSSLLATFRNRRRQRSRTAAGRFAAFLRELHDATGQRVVVLIDEYDKPISDALVSSRASRDARASPTTATDVARANRDFLRGLYAVIKDCDEHIRFAFLTGVSKFSKVSVFSGLNNLTDITLDPAYSAICGYTEEDLDCVFSAELAGLSRSEIRRWYNGYWWLGKDKVYNPFDVLELFRLRRFRAHWFETGTPTLLVETLFDRRIHAPDLDRTFASDALLSTFDVDRTITEALLWQTGYLTIVEAESSESGDAYRLGFPNHEVRASLNASLLEVMAPDTPLVADGARLRKLLTENDFDGMEGLFRSFFASIPYQWHTKNDIGSYEGYYASVYSWFASAGLDVRVEDSTNRGRLDMAFHFRGTIYLLELKVVDDEPQGQALAQIEAQGYAEKYRHLNEPICMMGVEFSRTSRNVAAFAVEWAS